MTCRRVCVCIKDYNVDEKVEALNRTAKAHDMSTLVTTARKLSDLSVCTYNQIPDRKCVDRKCQNCGTRLIRETYCPLIEKAGKEFIKYKQWQNVKESYTNRKGEIKETNWWLQAEKKAKVEDVVTSIETDMSQQTGH